MNTNTTTERKTMNHILNKTVYTIRTRDNIIGITTGIQSALDIVNNLETKSGVGVFFDNGNGQMSATFFSGWATKMNLLINDGIGWNGAKVA